MPLKGTAGTIDEFFAILPPDRREDLLRLFESVRAAMPQGYEQAIDWGMIVWQVPLSVYPDTYNKKPLVYVGIANQKNHMALYLCGAYAIKGEMEALKAAFSKAGKKLDMGAACVRFKRLDQLDMAAVERAIANVPVAVMVEAARAARHRK
jgi:hypothetical protein